MSTRTLSELAQLCSAELSGAGDLEITGPASLREAGPGEISFLSNARYEPEFQATRAGAVIVASDLAVQRDDVALLRTKDPSAAFSAVVKAFAAEPPRPEPGIAPTASVHPTAEIGEAVSIGAHCTVGAGARLAEGVVLHPNVVLGAGVRVGAATELHPGVVVYSGVEIGARCLLHAGVVLGADGFGFDPTPSGWVKIPQCGTVWVGDDVEIGANSSVDRARFGVTRIGHGVKIDNLVQVGHNCDIGNGALLCAQVGLAGTSRIGSGGVLAGQVGVAGHVTIGARARVGAQSGIQYDVEDGGEMFGSPAIPRKDAWRMIVLQRKLPELVKRIRELERRLAASEQRNVEEAE